MMAPRPPRFCYGGAVNLLHRYKLVLPLVAAAGCAPEPPPGPETDLVPQHDEEWPVAGGGRLVLSGQTLSYEAPAAQGLQPEDGPPVTIVADELVGLPAISADGARWALSRQAPGPGLSVLDVVELGAAGLVQKTLVAEGTPDRVAISADGQWVAWVSGVSGIASVWAMPFAGGPAVQLTNRALVRVIGEEPLGFVPPPHAGPLEILGDEVRWTSPAGAHAVPLP